MKRVSGFFKKYLHRIGIDRAIASTMINRFWLVIATPITLFLIVKYLTAEEQGFYYTFQSILAIQALVELGMGGVIMQFVSHEWAHLSFTSDHQIIGDSIHKDRFASLVRLGARWFAIGAVLVFIMCFLVGNIFLSSRPHPDVNWQQPWLLLVLSASALIVVSPYFPVLEGCHKIADVAVIRGIASIISTIVAWAALYCRLALYAPALLSLTTFIIYLLFLMINYRSLFSIAWLRKEHPTHRVNWKSEFWPMQWRTALTWGVSYFMWQLYTPVLFYYFGAVAAGQMGTGMSMALGLHTISLIWMTTKAPILGTLKARGQIQEMKKLFLITMKQSLLIYAVVALAAISGLVGVNLFFPEFAQRFPSPVLFGLLLLSFIATLIVGNMAIFLRSFKQEPLVWMNLASGIVIGLGVWQLGQRWGAIAMALTLLLAGIFLSLPWAFIIWYQKWKLLDSEVKNI